MIRDFDFDGSYDFSGMLRNQIAGKNNSWAIRWYASAFVQERLTLYPGRSLVKNIGFDGSGMHCTPLNDFNVNLGLESICLEKIDVVASLIGKSAYIDFYQSIKVSIVKKLSNQILVFFLGKIKW